MDFAEYQKEARKTAIYPSSYRIIYPALGLCGESGEVAEKIKKWIRDGKVEKDLVLEVYQELGDVLWYIANLAEDLGVNLDAIASYNLHKLRSRQERGVLKGSGDER